MKHIEKKALLKRRALLQRKFRTQWRACSNTQQEIDKINSLLGVPQFAEPTLMEIPGTHPITGGLTGPLALRISTERAPSRTQLVREVLERVTRQFTVETLTELINETYPGAVTPRDLSNTLWTLQRTGEIEIVKKGSGRRPTVYVRR